VPPEATPQAVAGAPSGGLWITHGPPDPARREGAALDAALRRYHVKPALLDCQAHHDSDAVARPPAGRARGYSRETRRALQREFQQKSDAAVASHVRKVSTLELRLQLVRIALSMLHAFLSHVLPPHPEIAVAAQQGSRARKRPLAVPSPSTGPMSANCAANTSAVESSSVASCQVSVCIEQQPHTGHGAVPAGVNIRAV
jgi:hypothetical protein